MYCSVRSCDLVSVVSACFPIILTGQTYGKNGSQMRKFAIEYQQTTNNCSIEIFIIYTNKVIHNLLTEIKSWQ